MNGYLGEPDKVLGTIGRWCEQAVAEQAELVLFPELVVHGHCTPNTWELAEPVPGPSTERLAQVARKYRLTLCVGLSEKDATLSTTRPCWSARTVSSASNASCTCLRDETLFYKGGKEIKVFDIGKCKVGVVICYDNQFPEVARVLALRGADVLLMPHAARFKPWADTPEAEAHVRGSVHRFIGKYALALGKTSASAS